MKLAPSNNLDAQKQVILNSITFELEPGDGLGVIGPSASGKSSLAKLLVGLWMPEQGSIRIDGVTYKHNSLNQIGHDLGYLPQQHGLIHGTIAQNIARFDPKAIAEDIIKAAMFAEVHEMILSFPNGYDTIVGTTIVTLSGGQTQRIALARAVYKRPKLVVLDEPNSNLDAEGDAALANIITKLREAGSIVVVMALRPSAITSVDKVLVLYDGQIRMFGEKSEVLREVAPTIKDRDDKDTRSGQVSDNVVWGVKWDREVG